MELEKEQIYLTIHYVEINYYQISTADGDTSILESTMKGTKKNPYVIEATMDEIKSGEINRTIEGLDKGSWVFEVTGVENYLTHSEEIIVLDNEEVLIGNVEIIGFRCFKGCTNLGNINIPASCKYIAWESFINAPNVNASFLGKETKLLYEKPCDKIFTNTGLKYSSSTSGFLSAIGSFTKQPFAAYDITCSGTDDAELLATEFFPKTTDITAQSLNGTVFDAGTTRTYK